MKKALITGSSSGIGRAIAEKFLSEGLFVFINHLPGEDTSELEKQWGVQYPGQTTFCPADLSGFTGLDTLCGMVTAQTNSLDILILNAGATDRGRLEDLTPETWSRILNINLTIPLFMVQRLQSILSEQGRILFTGSTMGILPHSMSLAYGVSKAAVHALTQNLPKFFENRSVTVNAVAPGFVDTPWQLDKPAEIRQNIENKVALHRFARPEEIAELYWHITQNGYINGSVLPIDGGYCYR